MKRKIVSLLSATMLLAFLVSCGAASTEPSQVPSAEPAIAASVAPTPSSADTFDKIRVVMEVDKALEQAIVLIQNDSDFIFDGMVSVYFKNTNGEQCGDDSIFVEGLASGDYTYARINITDVSPGITMDYSFSNSSTFTEGTPSSGGTLDEAASSELQSKFENGFGGAGNPANATSWFPSFVKVEVFNSGDSKYATITVKDDSSEEAIDRIGNAIFGNYAKKYGLSKVTAVTTNGTEVFTRGE